MGVQSHSPATLLLERTLYPLYRRVGGPQNRSGWVRKISVPPGFHPQNVQPVARRCIDYTNPDHTESNFMVGKFYIGCYGGWLSDF